MSDSGFGDARRTNRRELAHEPRSRHQRFGQGQSHAAHVAIVRVVMVMGMVLFATSCTRQTSAPRAIDVSGVSEADFVVHDRYRQPDKVLAAMPATLDGAWVADLGAGGGYFALRLARRVGASGRVVATDIADGALAALRTRAVKAGIAASTIETRRVAANDPGLEADRYAVILLSELDHLLVNRVDYFRQLRAALRTGGVIVVVNHERYREACRAALVEAGFAVEAITDAPPGQLLLRAHL